MKNFKINSIVLLGLIVLLGSCAKTEYDQPGPVVYSVDFEANTTIAELKRMTSGAYVDIPDSVIIKGTVISNDKFGNFYKKVIIQDSTGGIEIGIDQSGLYPVYPEGEFVYVKCAGLKVGQGKGAKEIALEVNGTTGRLPMGAHKYFLFRADGGSPIMPKLLKMSDLSEEHYNTLIKLKDVEVSKTDTSRTYYDENMNSDAITLTDYFDNELEIRTSEYADFSTDSLPRGNGTFIGVFNVYNGGLQIFPRTTSEINMTNDRIAKNIVFEENFTTDLGDFVVKDISGSADWYKSGHGNGTYNYAKIEGAGKGQNEDWLITPAIDLSSYQVAAFSFVQGFRRFTSWDDMTVWVSDDYDGVSDPNENATWTQMTGYHYPEAGSDWSYLESSGGIFINDFAGKSNVHIAFKYICTETEAASWEIESIEVSAQE